VLQKFSKALRIRYCINN